MFIMKGNRKVAAVLSVALSCSVFLLIIQPKRHNLISFKGGASKSKLEAERVFHTQTAQTLLGMRYEPSPIYNRTSMLPLVWEHLTQSWDAALSLTGSGPLSPLPGYRAPCWRENINQTILESSYKDNHFANSKIFKPSMNEAKRRKINSTLSKMVTHYNGVVQKRKKAFRFRCLPSLYIIGVPKGGTTDLFKMVAKHPMIVEPQWKENKFPKPRRPNFVRFIDYLEMSDETSLKIRTNPQYVTIDANIAYHNSYMNYTGQNNYNGSLNSVFYIRSINPEATLVMIMRNPVTRIRSLYYYGKKDGEEVPSAVKLHNIIVRNIKAWKICMKEYQSLRYCVINFKETDWTGFRNNFYYVFVKDILSLIPKEKVMFLHSESYFENRKPVLREIFSKMNLPPLSDAQMDRIAGRKVANKGSSYIDGMLPKTEKLLRNFFKPYNELVATLLQDDRFLWQK